MIDLIIRREDIKRTRIIALILLCTWYLWTISGALAAMPGHMGVSRSGDFACESLKGLQDAAYVHTRGESDMLGCHFLKAGLNITVIENIGMAYTAAMVTAPDGVSQRLYFYATTLQHIR